MKKGLLKKIVMAGGSILAFVITLFVRVSATNILVLGDTTTKRDAGSSTFFTFLNDAKDKEMFGLARVFMWLGFILVTVCMLYFVSVLVLELLGKNKVCEKMSLVTKVMQFVIIGSLILVLMAGVDKEQITVGTIAKETLNITLFNFSWVLSFVYGVFPLASEYLIKE